MKRIFALTVIAISFVFVSTAFAQGYGAAGCGLGSLVFEDDNSMIKQVVGATLNGTSGNQTFGITTGTSNCDTTGLVVAEKEQEVFAAKNFDSLSREMAVGSGEHLETLAGMMGHSAEQLGSYTKANYDRIFSSESTTPTEMLAAIKEAI